MSEPFDAEVRRERHTCHQCGAPFEIPYIVSRATGKQYVPESDKLNRELLKIIEDQQRMITSLLSYAMLKDKATKK